MAPSGDSGGGGGRARIGGGTGGRASAPERTGRRGPGVSHGFSPLRRTRTAACALAQGAASGDRASDRATIGGAGAPGKSRRGRMGLLRRVIHGTSRFVFLEEEVLLGGQAVLEG